MISAQNQWGRTPNTSALKSPKIMECLYDAERSVQTLKKIREMATVWRSVHYQEEIYRHWPLKPQLLNKYSGLPICLIKFTQNPGM